MIWMHLHPLIDILLYSALAFFLDSDFSGWTLINSISKHY
jgi:hypothetical protein